MPKQAKKPETTKKVVKTGAPGSTDAKVQASGAKESKLTSKKNGRPETPNKQAVALEIIKGIAAGDSLRRMAEVSGIAPGTFLLWVEGDKELSERYARARDMRADLAFEALEEIGDLAETADTAVKVNGLRLKADILKWKLARMSPKKYGDKVQVGGAEDLSPVQVVVKRYSDL